MCEKKGRGAWGILPDPTALFYFKTGGFGHFIGDCLMVNK